MPLCRNWRRDSGHSVKVAFAYRQKLQNKKQKPAKVVTVTPQPTMAQPEQPAVREEVAQPKTEGNGWSTPYKASVKQANGKIVYRTAIYFSVINANTLRKRVQNNRGTTKPLPNTRHITSWAGQIKTGTEVRNETISFRRAETVKRYLINKGIIAERISTDGKGIDVGGLPTTQSTPHRNQVNTHENKSTMIQIIKKPPSDWLV